MTNSFFPSLITLTPGQVDGKRVFRVAVEFKLNGDGDSGVLLTDEADAFMQQYGFTTISVGGLALDSSRVRRKPVPVPPQSSKGNN
jgi:hypothetical protein